MRFISNSGNTLAVLDDIPQSVFDDIARGTARQKAWDDFTPPAGFTKNTDNTITAPDGTVYSPRFEGGDIAYNDLGQPRFSTEFNDDIAIAWPEKLASPTESSIYFQANRTSWEQTPTSFNGNTVYQKDSLIDPNQISEWEENGIKYSGTNLERMATGRAPKGLDGNPIVLHHLTQTNDGAIAEMSKTFHKQNSGFLHTNTGQLPSNIDRNQFTTWRKNYWKDRATNWE